MPRLNLDHDLSSLQEFLCQVEGRVLSTWLMAPNPQERLYCLVARFHCVRKLPQESEPLFEGGPNLLSPVTEGRCQQKGDNLYRETKAHK